MVSLVTLRNTVVFGGALAAGIAAFTIAYGHDRGTPMRLRGLPTMPPSSEAHVTPRRLEPAPIPARPIAPPAPPIAAVPVAVNPASSGDAKPDPEVAKQIAALSAAARKRLDKTPIASGAMCVAVARAEQSRITKRVTQLGTAARVAQR